MRWTPLSGPYLRTSGCAGLLPRCFRTQRRVDIHCPDDLPFVFTGPAPRQQRHDSSGSLAYSFPDTRRCKQSYTVHVYYTIISKHLQAIVAVDWNYSCLLFGSSRVLFPSYLPFAVSLHAIPQYFQVNVAIVLENIPRPCPFTLFMSLSISHFTQYVTCGWSRATLRGLVACLSVRRSGFDFRRNHVRIIMNKLALDRVFSRYCGFSCQYNTPGSPHSYSSVYHRHLESKHINKLIT